MENKSFEGNSESLTSHLEVNDDNNNSGIKGYNSIELREDGMYDVSSDEGRGLCDEEMHEIIPAKYDDYINYITPLIIVSKNRRYGVVNYLGKDIVPCAYDSIKISKEEITIWDVESDYDPELEEVQSRRFLGFLNDSFHSDNTKIDDFFIVCINSKDNLSKFILFKNRRWIPNYYTGRRALGSICDVYLPNGRLIACFERLPAGGILYYKEFDAIMTYEVCQYDTNYGEFYERVQLDFFNLHKRSSVFEQAFLINSRYFLAKNGFGEVGIATSDSEEEQSEMTTACCWALPSIYYKMSLPKNDLIYAYRVQDDKQIVDIIDIKTKAKVVISLEIETDIYAELNNIETEHITDDIRSRIIKNDEENKLKYFPFERYYDNSWSSNKPYRRDDGSYRDAFEDDPEATWGRLD